MIVNFYSSTPASVLCGRDGCVCVYSLYNVYFSFLVLVWYTLSMKSLSGFQQTSLQLYGVTLVLLGMLANCSVK